MNISELTVSLSNRPQFSFLFDVLFDSTLNKVNNDDNSLVDLISKRVISVSCPFFKIEQDSVHVGNSKEYFARRMDIGNISMSILESEDGKTEKFLRSWLQLVINKDGSFNLPSLYKKTIRVRLLSTIGKLTKEYTYTGYYPLGINEKSLTYEASEALAYEVEFNGDSVEVVDFKLDPYTSESIPLWRRVFGSLPFTG